MPFLLRELRRAFIALGYFTRVPIPAWVGWSAEELNRAARYFPLIGSLVGGVAAVVIAGAAQLWPLPLAVLLSMGATILLTGGFHEDGLADSADGFGGGYTREQVLRIMQDSRIGSFGALALVLALLGKFLLLSALGAQSLQLLLAACMLAHPLSRAAALLVMARLPYARPDADSKARPVAEGIGAVEWGLGALLGLLPLLLVMGMGLVSPLRALLVLAAVAMVFVGAVRMFRRRIGGYTGDSLGATQQLTELAIYLALLADLG